MPIPKRRWRSPSDGGTRSWQATGAPIKEFFSRADDVSLGNPFGPFVSGWGRVEAILDRAAGVYSDGGPIQFDVVARHVGIDLACFVYVERFDARVGGAGARSSVALRVTTLFRREPAGWRIVHWHGDPITQPRSAESLTQAE
jgi:ketosteroid isomerase-like protein